MGAGPQIFCGAVPDCCQGGARNDEARAEAQPEAYGPFVEPEGKNVADGETDDPVADDLYEEAGVGVAGPRSAPVAVIWRPSKNWKIAATKSKGTVAAMTAGSSVKLPAMMCGKSKRAAEKMAMGVAPSAMAGHPAEAASAGPCGQWPGRRERPLRRRWRRAP